MLLYGTNKEQFDKKMLAVRSRILEINLPFFVKKSNLYSKPADSVSFLEYSISKEGISPDLKHVEKMKNVKAPTNNKQLESSVGLAIFNGRMIPDFATKMLHLNSMRNSDFSWGKMQKKPMKT